MKDDFMCIKCSSKMKVRASELGYLDCPKCGAWRYNKNFLNNSNFTRIKTRRK